MQNRAHHLWFFKSTSGLARKIENDLRKQVFGSQHENYLTDFQNSNGILSGLMKVIYKKCRCWKSTSGLDGKQLFVHKMRTTGRIFEIQTASIQVWSKWWQKNIGAENRLPVLTGKCYLLISWELLDGFSKFKRHMLRFDRSDDLTFSTLEIYFRCEQKDWKWALKHYFWKYFPFRIERATTSIVQNTKYTITIAMI